MESLTTTTTTCEEEETSQEEELSETHSTHSQYETDERPHLTTNDALLYLREVKQRFSDRKDIYDSFLDIMKEFKSNSVNISSVVSNVKKLLHGHEDLILGFNTFLPCSSQTTLAELRTHNNNDDDDDDVDDDDDDDHNVQKSGVELDEAINYINRIKARFLHDEHVYKTFLEILCCFRQGRMDIQSVYREVSELFQDHNDLLADFSFFLPEHASTSDLNHIFNTQTSSSINDMSSHSEASYSSASMNFKNDEADINYEEDLKFFDEVKNRIENPRAYQDLLKCLNLYAKDVITRDELFKLTQDVIGRYPDVMADFTRFISDVNNPFRDVNSLALRNRAVRRENQIKFNSHVNGSIVGGGSGGGGGGGGGTPGECNAKTMQMLQRQSYITKPISELDTEKWDRVTTSYVKLPLDFPHLLCSGKTTIANEIIQEQVVSVTTGTEDESSRQMRKNHYEDALFRGEDERYELELTMDRNRATIKALIPLDEQIESLSQEQKATYIIPPGTLKHYNYIIIQKVYGEKSKQIMDLLDKCPSATIPIVLQRLQQKDEEWENARETMMSHWTRVFNENYHKSMDHRSYQYKMNDKKTLLPKTLIQDLRDAADDFKRSDTGIKELSATISEIEKAPHMAYSFTDMDVFEDVYGVVRFSANKLLSSETWRQAMHLWTDFIEPFFGIQPHSWDPEMYDTDVVVIQDKSKSKSKKNVETMSDSSSPQRNSDNSSDRLIKYDDMEKDSVRDSDENKEPNVNELEAHKLEPLHTTSHDLNTNIEESKEISILYCNEVIYQLFRMIQILYMRLLHVRKCCRNEKSVPIEDYDMDFMSSDQATSTNSISQSIVSQEVVDKTLDSFRSLLYAFMDNSIDNDNFEDCCRDLLGNNAYVLFTLDKLIPRLVKQLHTVSVDKHSQKYLELYYYERMRGDTEYNQGCYLENVKVINNKETFISRITFSHKFKKLAFRLEDIPFRIPEKMAVCRRRTKYTNRLINLEVEMSQNSNKLQKTIFLRRNANKRMKENFKKESKDNDYDEYLKQFYIDNSLEARILPKKFKIGYIEQTTDILVKKRKRRIFSLKKLNNFSKANSIDNWALMTLGEKCMNISSIDELRYTL